MHDAHENACERCIHECKIHNFLVFIKDNESLENPTKLLLIQYRTLTEES